MKTGFSFLKFLFKALSISLKECPLISIVFQLNEAIFCFSGSILIIFLLKCH